MPPIPQHAPNPAMSPHEQSGGASPALRGSGVAYLDPLDAGERRRLSATRAELYRSIRSPHMPALPDGELAAYALLPHLEGTPKPCILPSLAALARRIHRERGGEGLQLRPTQVRFRDRVRQVTEVLAIDAASGRCRRIGFAWHAGRPWQALEAALDAAMPMAAAEV